MSQNVGNPVDSAPAIIRVAGNLEKLHITRNCLGIYTSVVVAAQYLSTSTTPEKLKKSTLFPALQLVVDKETALRVCIVGGDIQSTSTPAYAPCHVDDSVLERLTTFKDDVRWDSDDTSSISRLVEQELAIEYDIDSTTLPPWRLVVCGDNTVLFVYHHGLGDGKSGASFHVKLLHALNSTPSITNTPPSAPLNYTLSLPLEKCADLTPSLRMFVSEFFNLFAPISWTKPYSAWTGNAVIPVPRSSTRSKDSEKKKNRIQHLGVKVQAHMDLLELSAEDTEKLLRICRKHGATVTSAIYTVAVTILSRAVITDINTAKLTRSPYTTLSTLVPVSMRPHSGIPEVAFADHSSTWHTFPKLQSEFLWEDARQHAESLKNAMKKGGQTSQQVGMVKYLFGRYAAYFVGQMGRKREATLSLSNIGRFPDSVMTKEEVEGRKWKIGRTLFNQSDLVVGAAFSLDVIGHGSGGLTVSMTYGEDTLDAELGRKIVREMKEGLRGIVSGTKCLKPWKADEPL